MKYAMDERGDITVVHVEGKLAFEGSEDIARSLDGLMDRGRKQFVFDLSDVDFVSSDGLSVLLRVRSRVEPIGGWVRVACAKTCPYEVFLKTRLVEILGVYNNLDTALEKAKD